MGDTSSLRAPARDRIPEQKAYEPPEGPLRCAEFGPFVDVFVDAFVTVFVAVFVDGTRIGTLEVELTLLHQVAGLVAATPPPPPPSR